MVNPYDRILEEFAAHMSAVTVEFEETLKQAGEELGKLMQDAEEYTNSHEVSLRETHGNRGVGAARTINVFDR